MSPEACVNIVGGPTACAESRGADSGLFLSNRSGTWSELPLYQMADGVYLFGPDDAGSYGTDSVAVNTSLGFSAANVSGQVIAGYASPNFWLGMFGLNQNETSFNGDQMYASFLQSLKDDGHIDHLSFGYSVGKPYGTCKTGIRRAGNTDLPTGSPQALGSLTLGGYDLSRIEAPSLEMKIAPKSALLKLAVQNIKARNTLKGTITLMSDGGLDFQIDTATAQIWLPKKICDAFEDAFGLTFESEKNYYFINDTTHQILMNKQPQLTFFIGSETRGGDSMGITFSYSAFDMAVGLPYYSQKQRYFPIRRAANESQYVLGRAFLQETYLAVDWENNNFTIGKGIPRPESDPGLIPTSPAPEAVPSSDSGTNTGLIAGIAIGIVAVLAMLAVGYWYWRRRRRQQKPTQEELSHSIGEHFAPKHIESEAEKARRDTVGSQEVADTYGILPRYEATPTEIQAPHGHTMLMSNEILEMEGDCIARELRSAEDIRASLEQVKPKSTSVTVTEVG